jgi:hypothetical protein
MCPRRYVDEVHILKPIDEDKEGKKTHQPVDVSGIGA